MRYFHVDVFSSNALQGNGLTVVFPESELSSDIMLKITQEFKQFETIFIYPKQDGYYPSRVFTVEEELDFAGHPILGAAAVIHRYFENEVDNKEIKLLLGSRKVSIKSENDGLINRVVMNQGRASFIKTINSESYDEILSALNISTSDLYDEYPVEVISTGLPYLIIPVKRGLDRAKILVENFENIISKHGAKFAYLFDPKTLECRTWDNQGIVEDVATGSAAGPLFAYLVKNGYKETDKNIQIYQGRFVNRPSIIKGWVSNQEQEVFVEADVAFFSSGEITI